VNGSDISIATVVATNPVEVLMDTATTSVPAKRLGGASYFPVVNDRVLVLRLGRVLYILGGA